MGLFSRLGTLFKSNINDMISKAEDPEKMLNQIILDMKGQLVDAKKQVAIAIADEKRLRKQHEKEIEAAREWEKKAMMALKAGDEELAKEALVRKAEHDKLNAEYAKQWKLQSDATGKLKDQLRGLNNKIEEAKRKKNLLIARAKRAEAQRTIQETMSGLNDTSAFDTFDRMAAKVDQIEAEAEASAELAGEMSGDTLQNRFLALEESSGSDDALEALKAKMGMLPAAERPALGESKSAVNINVEIAEDAEVDVGAAEAEKEQNG